MNIKQRRNYIEQLVLDNGKVEIEDLVKSLGVSSMTIRRDLMSLENDNKLIRTHGGAVPLQGLINETPYSNKEHQFQYEKKVIAIEAGNIVEDGNTIILDSGTTTLELARVLKKRENLTIITNDILIAAEFVDSNVHVIVTGGELQNKVGAMFGPHTQELLSHINVDLMFLGAHAIHPSAGVTAPTLEKAKIKQMMRSAASESWLITDSSKFNKKSFATVCALNEVKGIITDDHVSHINLESYHENVITVSTKKEG
ncbi:DeoR/GlpR family DNA-binding transcription regulator [Evansella halocellulosilytica]|uniref:DeoR/GlpR family DNA-binding transcription regulator n=1 Tax=Evansella halocellulosilytica TaxID=2011013 RepID=UPI000BB9B3D4|nr:DeoR/GlpR family DNA-binding transcription regulator [Evansella halocellulosilytica]